MPLLEKANKAAFEFDTKTESADLGLCRKRTINTKPYVTNDLQTSNLVYSYPAVMYHSRVLSGITVITFTRVKYKKITIFSHNNKTSKHKI